MLKKPLKIMEKCAIASFLHIVSDATRMENFHRADAMQKNHFVVIPMPKGRPKKVIQCNISGLRNQKRLRSPSPAPYDEDSHQGNIRKQQRGIYQGSDTDSEEDWDACLAADGDSTKVVGYDVAEYRGEVQKMTTNQGDAKGLQQVLEEQGFNVQGMRAKCKPVCPWENDRCCMARLLSKQDDFAKQESMLEAFIRQSGHQCIFLPKFHCELNPIEMVRSCDLQITNLTYIVVLGLV